MRALIAPQLDAWITSAQHGTVVIDSDSASLAQAAVYECAAALQQRAAMLFLPSTADRITFALLDLAGQCDRSAVVAQAIERTNVDDACDILEDALQGRIIVAVGRPLATDDNFGVAALSKDEESRVGWWLKNRPSIRAASSVAGGSSQPTHFVDVEAAGLTSDVRARWISAKHDVFAFKLLSAHHELGVQPNAWEAEELANNLWRLIPQRLRALLTTLSLQDRPALRTVIEAATNHGPTTLSLARRLGVVRAIADSSARPQLMLDDDFAKWMLFHVRPRLSRAEVDDVHSQLAGAFERAFDASRDPELSLEAQRHYGNAGRFDDVRRFSAVGARTLIDAGRALSRQLAYEDAARAYECALQLDEGSSVLSLEARGYARHYTHFNRYKAQTESLRDTRDGYEKSLAEWSDNALFWSRFIRAEALCGALAAARTAQRRAFENVPDHAARDGYLVDRVVDRLLARECWVEATALAIESDKTNARALLIESVERPRLVRRLVNKRFASATLFAMHTVNGLFECAVPGFSASGATPARALDALDAALPSAPGPLDVFECAASRMLTKIERAQASLTLDVVLWLREAERRAAHTPPEDRVRALLDEQKALPLLHEQRAADHEIAAAVDELRAAGLCARRSNGEEVLILGGRSEDSTGEIATYVAPFSIRREALSFRVRVSVGRSIVEERAATLNQAVKCVRSCCVRGDAD